MSDRWKSKLTKQGLELLTNLDGKTLKFTQALCGEGETTDDLSDAIKLVDPKHELTIVENKGVSGIMKLKLRLDNSTVDTPFKLNQIGLYAKSYDGSTDPDTTDKGILLQIFQTSEPDSIVDKNDNTAMNKDYVVSIHITDDGEIVVHKPMAVYVEYDEFDRVTSDLKNDIENLKVNENLFLNPDLQVSSQAHNTFQTTYVSDAYPIYYQHDVWFVKAVDKNYKTSVSTTTAKSSDTYKEFAIKYGDALTLDNNNSSVQKLIIGQFIDAIHMRRQWDVFGNKLTLSAVVGGKGNGKLKISFYTSDTDEGESHVIEDVAFDTTRRIEIPVDLIDKMGTALRVEFEIELDVNSHLYIGQLKLEVGEKRTKYIRPVISEEYGKCGTYFEWQSYTKCGHSSSSSVSYVSNIQFTYEKISSTKFETRYLTPIVYGNAIVSGVEIHFDPASTLKGKAYSLTSGGVVNTLVSSTVACSTHHAKAVMANPSTVYGYSFFLVIDGRFYSH